MNVKAQVVTLGSLTHNVDVAAATLKALDFKTTPHDEYVAAKENVRKASEAVRVFCYRSKTGFTASGRVIRH